MNKSEAIQKTKEGAKKFLSPKFSKIESIDDLKTRAMTTLFYGGFAFVSWRFIIKPQWNKYKLNRENEKILSNPNTQLASLLRQAIIGTGTNVSLVMDVAKKITDWDAVQTAYKNLTKNNLNEDLYGDLSSSQYQQFMNIVNHNITANKSKSKKGYIVVSNKTLRLRETPDSSISVFSFIPNILATVNSRLLLGFATGVFKTDSKGVLYYQVRIKYTAAIPNYHQQVYRKQKSRILTYWVGAGAILMFKDFKQMRISFPSVKLYKGTKDTGLRQGLR